MSIRFVFVVTGAILASALFAWYVKGDLEMGWLAMGPIIVGFSVLAGAVGSLLLPGGFPRIAAVLAAFPFGVLLAWLAMFTTNAWSRPPQPEWMDVARAKAADHGEMTRVARATLNIPVEIGEVRVDSTNGLVQKVSDSFRLQHRPPQVRLSIGFAIGPRQHLVLDVQPDGALRTVEQLPATDAVIVRPEAVRRLYPDVTLVEFGGSGPFPVGAYVALRLMEGEADWSLAVARLVADGETFREVARLSREQIVAAITQSLGARGERVLAIDTYFRPAGQRVLFMVSSEFDWNVRLENRGGATVRAVLEGDSIRFDVVSVRR